MLQRYELPPCQPLANQRFAHTNTSASATAAASCLTDFALGRKVTSWPPDLVLAGLVATRGRSSVLAGERAFTEGFME